MTASYIFGSGGHARVIASMLDGEVQFVVPKATCSCEISEADFFERIEDYRHRDIYIGVGSNNVRRKIFNLLTRFDARIGICIAPNAFIARDTQIERGAVICPGSVVGSRAMIDQNTIINTLSSVDHDCIVGAHSQITAGVTIAGTVDIGQNCFFGVKSAVVPDVTIGDDVTVMAGAIVTANLAHRVTVGGSPARVMRMG